jgi:membrane-anchored mycosin MYCP
MMLAVGGVGQNGEPTPFSMHGPWVGTAAPADNDNIVARGPESEPADALPGKDGPVPITGTSLAAAYVRGRRRC